MIAWLRPACFLLGLVGSLGCNPGGQGGHAASPADAPGPANADAAPADPAALLAAAQAARVLEAQIVVAAIIADELDAHAGLTEAERDPDVIYVPTPEPVVDRMLELAAVKEDDVVYDLGCGDGRIVITAAQRYGVKAWGFDIDPVRVAEARENAKAAGVEDLVTIEQKDIFTLDLSPASVVTLYLLPELNVRLIPQLEQLKPGSRIVSHDFDMEGVTPEVHETLTLGPRDPHEIFLWRTPLLQPVPVPVPVPESKPAPTEPVPVPESKPAPTAPEPEPESKPAPTEPASR